MQRAPKNEQRAKKKCFVWIPLEVGRMHPVVWLVSGRPIAIVIAIVWIRLEVGFILDSIGGRIYLGFHWNKDLFEFHWK